MIIKCIKFQAKKMFLALYSLNGVLRLIPKFNDQGENSHVDNRLILNTTDESQQVFINHSILILMAIIKAKSVLFLFQTNALKILIMSKYCVSR